MRIGYLGLGSNVGDRVANLARRDRRPAARAASPSRRSPAVTRPSPSARSSTSPTSSTSPSGSRTGLEPEELLDACKAVEADAGRDFDAPRHSPRPVDVDLLLLGDLELSTERLTLPHREVTARRFVLVPLLELDPGLRLPDGTSLGDCLEALGDRERVEPFGPVV